jgi:hypothetical protein
MKAKNKNPSPTHPTSGLPPLADSSATSTDTHRHQDRGNGGDGRGDEQVLGDDLLFGADEIGAFLKKSPRWVYYQQRNLGLGHIGATLVGSKRALTKLFSGEAI